MLPYLQLFYTSSSRRKLSQHLECRRENPMDGCKMIGLNCNVSRGLFRGAGYRDTMSISFLLFAEEDHLPEAGDYFLQVILQYFNDYFLGDARPVHMAGGGV
jgi:hypothetical protein